MSSAKERLGEHLRGVLVACVLAGIVAGPFVLRERSIAQLRRQYDETAIGAAGDEVQRRLQLEMRSGVPPERYRNDVWSATAGDRAKCRSWGVRHGRFLATNHSLLVGFDAERRVAFKAVGNT